MFSSFQLPSVICLIVTQCFSFSCRCFLLFTCSSLLPFLIHQPFPSLSRSLHCCLSLSLSPSRFASLPVSLPGFSHSPLSLISSFTPSLSPSLLLILPSPSPASPPACHPAFPTFFPTLPLLSNHCTSLPHLFSPSYSPLLFSSSILGVTFSPQNFRYSSPPATQLFSFFPAFFL